MPPDIAAPIAEPRARGGAVPSAWRPALIRLAVVEAALLLAFLPEWRTMAAQWWNSSTYNHVLLVPPILVWLICQRAGALRGFAPQGWAPGLALFAATLLPWLAGRVSGLDLAAQGGAVLAMEAAALTLLGPRIGWALAFPLAYALFLVPFGDELVPAMQMVTARITIALTQWSGVAAEIEGVFIDTPVGLFEVAEACSGVKFLIAMVALGVLVANVGFLSWRRRIAFVALAAALPVVANGVRAWGTIYIAQSQGIVFAAGFDHIFYGWVFFALIVAVLLAVAWRTFDRPADAPFVDPGAIRRSAVLARLERLAQMPAWAALAALFAIGAVAVAWAGAARGAEAVMPARIALPAVPGWQRIAAAPAVPWVPRAAGADHRLQGRYRDRAGHTVDVFLAFYTGARDGYEAGGFGEGALPPGSAWRWYGPERGPAHVQAERLLADGAVQRVAQTSYRTGALITGNRATLKLAEFAARIALDPQPTAVLIVSAEEQPGGASAAIAAFRTGLGDEGAWIDAIGLGSQGAQGQGGA